MTFARFRCLVAMALGLAVLATSPVFSQTTPRTGGRPAPTGGQGAAPKTNGAAPKSTAPAAKKEQEGKSTPLPASGRSTTPKKTTVSDDEGAPRTASLPSSSKMSDNKSGARVALPPTPKEGDGAPPQIAIPVAPIWHPVKPDEEKYIDEVLAYWEASTAKIKTYKCDFDKFTYNPNYAPPGTYYEHSVGVIMYAQPDKGMYKVEQIDRYRVAKEKGGPPEYIKAEGEKGEHWICDGKAVFYFDYLNKILRKTNLPPVLQGKAIADGPLPFVFGAEAAKIKQRYWLHVVTPETAKDEIHLAAVPKLREDAANYKEIKIIIDYESYLPKAMIVFMPGYDKKTNDAKDNYIFKKRQNNLTDNIWLPLAKQFYQPSTPDGWKLEVQEVPRQEMAKPAAPRNPAPPVVSKSQGGTARK